MYQTNSIPPPSYSEIVHQYKPSIFEWRIYMRIFDFEMKHVEDAKLIAIANYNEEREYVPILPSIDILPDLDHFASNGLGVVAFDKGRMAGFLLKIIN